MEAKKQYSASVSIKDITAYNSMEEKAVFLKKVTVKYTWLKYLRRIFVMCRTEKQEQDHQDCKSKEILRF